MTEKTICYLDMWVGERIQEMKLAGIRRFAEMCGWNVCVVPESRSRPPAVRALLSRLHPLGCIVECSASHDDLRPGLFRGVPTVWLDCSRNFCGGKLPMVVHDGEATTRVAFRELAANRPSSYAVVGYAHPRAWSRLRVREFRARAEAEGMRCAAFSCRKESPDARQARLAAFIRRPPRHVAVFAVNDDTAVEVAAACRTIGKAIPSDLTLLGIDNIEAVCESLHPRLSSVQIDFEQAGYRAARRLDAMIAGRDDAGKRQIFGPLLTVRRESTRGFGRREPRILAAVELIRREACSGLTAAEVVKCLGGSRRLSELRFREMMGHSILDEIMNIRLEKVCFLLSRTDTAIGAIAAQCGFGSDIALSKLFHRRFDMSLLAWRKQSRAVR
jgi:LacI family transcriptional regulator